MFITVQSHEYDRYSLLLVQMHRLRKIVFHDTLKWDVPIKRNMERDYYDDCRPVYLIWCSTDQKTLFGSMRLLPTTGPTLLYDVFGRTIPEAAELSAPGIWEATRCCVNAAALAEHHPEIDQGRAFGFLCLAVTEVARAHAIHTLIFNYEPQMRRIYARAGAEIQELGRADGYGRRPVCCGAFEVSESVIQGMRAALGVDAPLYSRRFAAGMDTDKWLAA
jgi:acyl homoserine lactone synthase